MSNPQDFESDFPPVSPNMEVLLEKYRLSDMPTFCEAKTGSFEGVRQRVKLLESYRKLIEYDQERLILDFLDTNPTLTENERRVAAICHRRLIDFWFQCKKEVDDFEQNTDNI